MKKGTYWIGGVVLSLVLLAAFALPGASEKVSETLKRTRTYTSLVGNAQTAQDKLNSFIEAEQKTCVAKGGAIQLSPQGLLTCLVTPKTPPAQAAPQPAGK